MKKIISLFVLLILLSGCSKKDALYYQDMADVVISLFQDVNYDKSDFSRKENEAIEKVVSELTHENHKINVSDFIEKTQMYVVNEKNSEEIFKENGECFIYYKDLGYYEYTTDENHYELEPHKRLVCDGYYTVLYASDFYPEYELTKVSPLHHYAYINFNEYKDGYNYIYKSTYDGSYLVIDINTEEMEINLLNDVPEEEIVIEEKGTSVFSLIIVIFIFIGLVIGLIALKNKTEEKY